MATARERQEIAVLRDGFADLRGKLDVLEARGADPADVARLRADINAADPSRPVAALLCLTDAVVGAAQLRTIAQLFTERMPEETRTLFLRIAAALEAAS